MIQVHTLPRFSRVKVEWEMARVLQRPVAVRWRQQPAIPGMLCGLYEWEAPAGTAATLASALFGWRDLRFDLYEAACDGNDGVRFSHTPRLGLFRAQIDVSGATVVSEDRLRLVMENAGADATALRESINDVLGAAWDAELDPLRAVHFDVTVAS